MLLIERIFENEHFVVVDKAGGVLSTPARLQDKDSRACLEPSCRDK